MSIQEIAFHQGISDWLRFKNRCPVYWRGTDEEAAWKRGHNYARRYNS
jgi:hypothetical protein